MSTLERPGVTADRPVRRSRLADLGDRLARTFGTMDRTEEARWDRDGDLPEIGYAETEAWDPVPLRFPVVRHGYDCVTVDEYMLDLERQLEELRSGSSAAAAVNEQLERVGEQTASILQLAYEQAHEITRRARAEADGYIAEATAKAAAMAKDARQSLRVLDTETDAVWRERARLIEDVRGTATALFALAEDAADRFPAETERLTPEPVRAALTPQEAGPEPAPEYQTPVAQAPEAQAPEAQSPEAQA